MTIIFKAKLTGDGECEYLQIDRETAKIFNPHLDEQRKQAEEECADWDEKEKKMFMGYIEYDEKRLSLSDILRYFGCEDKDCEITINVI